MNIHELNYVLCIAKHQNMTKAARELYISQPTLSKHLGKLERELGIKLFNRVDNCYIPTYAGRRYMGGRGAMRLSCHRAGCAGV